MMLMIASYGTKIRKQYGCIVVEDKQGTVQKFLPQDVEAIVMSHPCTLTSEVISLCQENDVSITMTDPLGMPIWHIEPFQGGSVPLLRRKQLLLCECAEGVQFVQSLLSMKLKAQANFLLRLARNRRDERGDRLHFQSKQILDLIDRIRAVPQTSIAECRPALLGYEGTAGRLYFSALSKVLPPEADFTGRQRGFEAGSFNQMLNYGYGVLYREIFAMCSKARLDPYIGVMHADGYNRPSLVYDLAEPFRAEVDQAVFFLFSRRRVDKAVHFENCAQGTVLSKEGKQLLMEAVCHVRQEKHYGSKMQRLISGLTKGLGDWMVNGGTCGLVDHL